MKLFAKRMITNVQILTENGSLTAVVEPEKRISAAYQNMRTIPNVLLYNWGRWVEVLDLSHNKIRDVSPLIEMQNLHTLILDHNLIMSTTVFPKLPTLRVLWLNFNLISGISLFVPPLSRSCPNLHYLSLMGNMVAPITEKDSSDKGQECYRRYVLSHFEHLRYLDDKPVTTIERIKVAKEEPTLIDNIVDNVQNFFHDISDSVMVKINRNFNSIV